MVFKCVWERANDVCAAIEKNKQEQKDTNSLVAADIATLLTFFSMYFLRWNKLFLHDHNIITIVYSLTISPLRQICLG